MGTSLLRAAVAVGYVVVVACVTSGAVSDDQDSGALDIVLGIVWLAGSVAVGLIVRRAWALGLPLLAVGGFVAVGPDSPATYGNHLWALSLIIVPLVSALGVAIGLGLPGRRAWRRLHQR